ncbi:MAG: hypothetical protein M3143_11260 [Actinomycetota bacterium]|nr:hypothetical protein [Actinomycetota bacterium]
MYQTLVRLDPDAVDAGRIMALTALLRWDHPERGVVAHEDCVALTEQTGLVLSIGPCRSAAGPRRSQQLSDPGSRPWCRWFALASPVPLMRRIGTAVAMAGIDNAAQVQWWRNTPRIPRAVTPSLHRCRSRPPRTCCS